jgi:phage shock protein PspC (stress-responsive transcriptional regulator)
MRKVTTINLNNNAFQIDEDGYESLRRYLDDAGRALSGNPDREEILADLEQAIADKCRATLGVHKTVVGTEEIERIVKEMGPVTSGNESTGAAGASQPGGEATGATSASPGRPSPRRLYRIREGMQWAGVCTGTAAYAGIDVSLVRIAVILITVFTGFFPGLVVYVALAFILPVAGTPEELAAASGAPFNAQELVERVKKKHEEFRDERRSRRGMKRGSLWFSAATSPQPQPAPGYAARVTGGVLLPVLTVISAVWFAAMAIAGYSVWWAYRFGGLDAWPPGVFQMDGDIPFWVAMAAVVAVYALIAIPLGAGRRASRWYANGGRLHGWADAWSGLLWVAIVAVLLLVAMYQLPQLQWLLRGITGTHVTVMI